MIRILQRGGIHRTKFEFGPFNRKFGPKRNKKRAVIVQRMPTKWVGSYAAPQDTGEKRKGWNIWELKGLPFNKTMKVKVDTGGRTLEPGEAITCNPDGTYSPFKGASITMRSETVNKTDIDKEPNNG